MLIKSRKKKQTFPLDFTPWKRHRNTDIHEMSMQMPRYLKKGAYTYETGSGRE